MDETYIDNYCRELYQQRSQSPVPMTDERWERIKTNFPGSVRVLREEALAFMEEDGE